MLSRSTKPNRCRHCKERMPADKASHVIHEACIAPFWEALQEKTRREERKAKLAAAKVERAYKRKRKEALKTYTELEKECREIVQEIARIRDRHDGCISCHMGPNYGGVWHGSHFRPAGNHGAVQFHLSNIHKACAQCNLFKGGNLGPYRPRLIEKIGQDRVDWLESQNQVIKHNAAYREYLIRFKRVMGKRLRRIKKSALKEQA